MEKEGKGRRKEKRRIETESGAEIKATIIIKNGGNPLLPSFFTLILDMLHLLLHNIIQQTFFLSDKAGPSSFRFYTTLIYLLSGNTIHGFSYNTIVGFQIICNGNDFHIHF